MADMPKSGTGDEFARVDLGPIGDLVIEDDGDPDRYLNVNIETPNGGTNSARSVMMDYRQNNGDNDLEAALQAAFEAVAGDAGGRGGGASGMANYGVGIFVCDDCCRSWPRRKNQTPNSSVDTCPDCAGGGA